MLIIFFFFFFARWLPEGRLRYAASPVIAIDTLGASWSPFAAYVFAAIFSLPDVDLLRY